MPFENENKNSSEASALESLVGDGKKFKTVDDLAKGKMEADDYIKQLQAETAEFRKMLEQNTERDQKLDQIFERMSTMTDQRTPASSPSQHTTDPTSNKADEKKDLFTSQEELDQYVTRLIEGRETASKASSNLSEVQQKLEEKFKDKSAEFVQKRANELNITVGEMKALAEKSPSAFYRMMDMDSEKSSSLTFAENISSPEMSSKTNEGTLRNRDWWNNQRREKGSRWFFKPENQKLYFADASNLGSKF